MKLFLLEIEEKDNKLRCLVYVMFYCRDTYYFDYIINESTREAFDLHACKNTTIAVIVKHGLQQTRAVTD